MQEFVNLFWNSGAKVNLDDCHYGLFHDGKTYLRTSPYYRFLAGLVKSTSAKTAIEIGTYRGGSTSALAAGMDGGGIQIATIDVKDFNPSISSKVLGNTSLKQIIGDPLAASTIVPILELFPSGVDVLFVDGAHDGATTLAQTLLYDKLFTPSWIILDDVNLNSSMALAFSTLRLSHPGIFDISLTHPHIRRPSEGFAVWARSLNGIDSPCSPKGIVDAS